MGQPRLAEGDYGRTSGVVLWKDLPLDEVYDAVRRETSQAAIPIRWILDCIRQHGGEPALQIADFVRKNRTNGAGWLDGFAPEIAVVDEIQRGLAGEPALEIGSPGRLGELV